jgi:hypothetical protein
MPARPPGVKKTARTIRTIRITQVTAPSLIRSCLNNLQQLSFQLIWQEGRGAEHRIGRLTRVDMTQVTIFIGG